MTFAALRKSDLVFRGARSPGWTALIVLLGTLLAAPGVRAALDAGVETAVAQATALNRKALALYEGGDFEEAHQAIKQALAVCEAAALEQHPLYARTWLHLGIVLLGGLHQSKEGLAAFRKALALQPGITLNSDLASPELRTIFDEARRALAVGSTATPEQAVVDSSAASPLVHTSVKEGQRGSAISITVVVPSTLVFDKLVLAYRKADGDEFLGRPMKAEAGGSFTAEIPSSATGGTVVSYFIEAMDVAGQVVAARGSLERPLVIALEGDRAGAVARRDEADEADAQLPARRLLVAFTIGRGVGVASGTGDLNADVMTTHAKLASAGLLHLSPEVGLWISRSLLLSLQGRLELVTGTTDLVVADHRYHAAGRAAALFARASWLFRPRNDFQPLFSLALGVGQIRYLVTFDAYKDCGDDQHQRCVDTVTAGPFLAGAGTGFLYALTETVALVVQVNAQLAAPHSTLNFDGNLGAAMRF